MAAVTFRIGCVGITNDKAKTYGKGLIRNRARQNCLIPTKFLANILYISNFVFRSAEISDKGSIGQTLSGTLIIRAFSKWEEWGLTPAILDNL